MLAKDHRYPAPRKLRQGFLGGGVKLYAICFQRMINNCACLVVFDSDSWFGPHMAAVDPSCADTTVRALRTFIQDLRDLADWFKACGVTSVAMESTGVYSIPAYEILEQHGFEVILVTAHYAKNVPGRKTDVSDAAWLRQLHSYGLFRGSFRPDAEIATLRAYLRQRERPVEYAAAHIQHMQKALTEMNLQLHHVVSDIAGATGEAP